MYVNGDDNPGRGVGGVYDNGHGEDNPGRGGRRGVR